VAFAPTAIAVIDLDRAIDWYRSILLFTSLDRARRWQAQMIVVGLAGRTSADGEGLRGHVHRHDSRTLPGQHVS
jgi:catechol 2,3-dioxygenase-like lactoylglutathione lyase family enzyme